MRHRLTRVTVSAAIAAGVALSSTSAIADTPTIPRPEEMWGLTDSTIHVLGGDQQSEICVGYVCAPPRPVSTTRTSATPKPAPTRRATTSPRRTVRQPATKRTATKHRRTTTGHRTPRVAGQIRYPWRPTTTCRPLTRTATGQPAWTVRRGDTWWLVSQCTRRTVGQLQAANSRIGAVLQPGTRIVLPTTTAAVTR